MISEDLQYEVALGQKKTPKVLIPLGSIPLLISRFSFLLSVFLRHPCPLILIQVDFSHPDGFRSDF